MGGDFSMTPGYVFISYSSKEYAQANELRQLLQNNGISCWMAPESIASGSNYATAIPSAIRGCSVFLLLLTQASQESRWVPREVDVAINSGKRIIPYMIQNCPITDTFDFYLIGVQRLEAFRAPRESGERLLFMIRQEIGSFQEPSPYAPYQPVSSTPPPRQEQSPPTGNVLTQVIQKNKAPDCCPACNERNLWRKVDEKKKFSIGKAAVGAVILGPVGLIGGAIGKKKVLYHCGKCGFQHEYNG